MRSRTAAAVALAALALTVPGRASAERADFPSWFDASGAPAPEDVLVSSPAGPCGDGSTGRAEFLFAAHVTAAYAYDPDGELPSLFTLLPFDADTSLPPTARDTGFAQDDRSLWTAAGVPGVYVVLDDGAVEFWPQLRPLTACD